MAKKSSDEYLAGILNLLDSVINENKKTVKPLGQSNVPGGAGIVKADAKNIEILGNSLKALSSAIPALAKISDKQYETVANGIKKIGEAISSFKLDKDALAGIGNAISAFVLIHNVITNLSENFVKSIMLLNPIKAWILGKRLGKFYGMLTKGMTKEFFKNLVDIINVIPPNSKVQNKTFLKRLTNLGLMMTAILKIKKEDIMQLWFMGTMLGPKTGAAIGGFFKELIDKMAGGPGGTAKANAAAKVALSVSAMIGTLTISLIALVLLFKMNKWEDLLGGSLMLISVVGLALGIIKILGSDKFKRSKNEAISGAKDILLLIGGLTLSLVAIVLLSKKTRWEDLVKGGLMLTALIALSLGLMYILGSDKFKKAEKNGLIGVGSVIVLMLGLSLAMLVFVKYINSLTKAGLMGDDGWKKFGRAIGMMGALVGGILAVVAILGAISLIPGAKTFLATGAVMLGAIAGIIFVITEVTDNFVNLIERIHGLTQDSINDAVDKIIGKSGVDKDGVSSDDKSLLGALSSIISGMVKFGGWASIKVGVIALSIKPVISTIADFVDVVQKMASMKIADEWDEKGKPKHYMKLTPDAFNTAAKNLIESFNLFLTELSNGLKGFDLTTVAIINLLFPRQSKLSKWVTGEKPGIGAVIHILSDFVDIIQKMASLSVPDKWDKNGNPISYRLLKSEEFGTAAKTLSKAFGIFVTELGKGLESVSLKAAVALEFLSGPLGELLPGIASIMDPIILIAVGKIAVGDKTYDINLPKMKKAAIDIVKVIESLLDPLKELSAKDIDEDDIKEITDSFAYVLENFSKYADSFVFKKDFIKLAAWAITGFTQIGNFLTNPKRNFDLMETNAGMFEDAMEDFVDGIKELKKINIKEIDKKFIDNNSNLIKGLSKVTNYLQMTKYFEKAKANSKNFKESMKNTATGIKSISPFLKSTPALIRDLAKAMKELDLELIEKEEKRTEAIQSISSNFKDMAENIEKLNNSLSRSMSISKAYSTMKENTSGNILQKGANAIVEATGYVAERVEKAITGESKKEEQRKIEEEKKQKERETLSNAIANAVLSAMSSYYDSHKDITIQLGDDSQKIFGEVYNS